MQLLQQVIGKNIIPLQHLKQEQRRMHKFKVRRQVIRRLSHRFLLMRIGSLQPNQPGHRLMKRPE
jgi:hypothetical protein